MRAEGPDWSVYGYPAYASLCGTGKFKTAARKTKEYGVFPPGYADALFMKKKPQKGDWDPGKGENFQHFIKPYWHNAHHLVPNGALKNAINKTGDDDWRLPELIKAGLLKGNYNLNGQVNMIILPQEKNVAAALELPRHLKGDESIGGDPPEFYSHSDYSNSVEDALEDVINDYKASIDVETHPDKPPTLAAQKLNDVSDIIHEEIISRGKRSPGSALSELGF